MKTKKVAIGASVSVGFLAVVYLAVTGLTSTDVTLTTYQGYQALQYQNVLFVVPPEQWCFNTTTTPICCSTLQGCYTHPTEMKEGMAYCKNFRVENDTLEADCFGYKPRWMMNQNITKAKLNGFNS